MLWSWWVNSVVASRLVPKRLRWRLLRMAGLDVGPSAVAPGVFFGARCVRVGADTFLNERCFLDGSAQVDIGARCAFGPGVMLLTSSHEPGDEHRRAGPLRAAPVTIGDGCWVGARATILPGVTVGAGSVVAAGAVVTSDCDSGGLYAGVPARRVRDLSGRLDQPHTDDGRVVGEGVSGVGGDPLQFEPEGT